MFYLDFKYDKQENLINTIIKAYNADYPKREIKNEKIYSCIWENDNIFYYSITGKGLYKYDCINGNKTTILNENREYNIKKIENNYLFFDEAKIKI